MSLDLIIEQEIRKVARQKLMETNTYGFPEGKVDSGKVVSGGEGGNWGGSMERALELLDIARDCKGSDNIVSSQKRSRVKTASGNVSDHYVGNISAYAVDIPARGESGDKLLACIMKKWRVSGHYDHIHIGVKKNGGKIVDDVPFDKSKETKGTKDFSMDSLLKIFKGSSSDLFSKLNNIFKDFT